VTLCASCGLERDGRELCAQHDYSVPDGWAEGNRVWCDLFHRGIELLRVAPELREDAMFTATAA
jgi:hypothetical protein